MGDILFNLVKFGAKCRFKKPDIFGMDNVDTENPAIFLSNHERFYGPVIITTRFPIPVRQWATSLIVNKYEAKKYVQETLFRDTLHFTKGASRFLGGLLGVPISWAIRNANPIPAYWDPKRTRESIQLGLEAIENGEHQYIYAPHQDIMSQSFEFLQGFLILAKYAEMRLDVIPNLYPVALNRKNSTIAIGQPTTLNPDASFKREGERLNEYIKNCIRVGYTNPYKMAKGIL